MTGTPLERTEAIIRIIQESKKPLLPEELAEALSTLEGGTIVPKQVAIVYLSRIMKKSGIINSRKVNIYPKRGGRPKRVYFAAED